jgi:hypothetical protein
MTITSSNRSLQPYTPHKKNHAKGAEESLWAKVDPVIRKEGLWCIKSMQSTPLCVKDIHHWCQGRSRDRLRLVKKGQRHKEAKQKTGNQLRG